MRRFSIGFLLAILLLPAAVADAASGKVVKVLPHHLDEQGRHTLSPSLFDRDAYQAHLRQNPQLRAGQRFDICWRARAKNPALTLRVDLRGVAAGGAPREHSLSTTVKPSHGLIRWTGLTVRGDEFRALGEVTAWRVTLWDGDQLLGEQKSLLW